MMIPRIRVLSFLFVVALVPIFGLEAQESKSEKAGEKSREVRIPIEEGGVDAAQLFDAVSDEVHWVAGTITAFTRGFGVTREGMHRLPKSSIDELAERFPDSFRYEGPVDAPSMLVVDVDKLSSQLADRKSKLRLFLADSQGATLASLEQVESTWREEVKSPPRVVVVLSGFHGVDSSSAEVAKAIHARTNLPTCVFDYPNDGPIAESAGLLVLELQDFHREHPMSKVTLVTHSMGGLVARAALELNSPSTEESVRASVADRTGVDQLIQVCPPNHGSALAEYGPLLEGAEQLYRLVNRRSGRKARVLFRAIVDGFNEASEDLAPGSAFLDKLNTAERNPEIRYSIILGNDGPLRGLLTTLVGNIWEQIAASVDEPKELDRRIREVLECDELQNGKGDGVVSLSSGVLEGVKDTEILPVSHLVWMELEESTGQQMVAAVAKRLGISL